MNDDSFDPTELRPVGSNPSIPPPPPPGPHPYQQPNPYTPVPPVYEPSATQMPTYQQPNPYTVPPLPYETSRPPRKGKDQKKNSRLFIILAIIAIVVVVGGGLSWFLTRNNGSTSSKPAPVVVARGQVSFLDSQDSVPGTTNALKITATGLSNPPDGSVYDAWLVDTTNEQILALGSLSKSDPTTFALSFPNASSQTQTNLIGAGNKVEVTQEQGSVTEPTGKVVLSATFPPQAFVHIRHLLFKFPTTPGNIGLLTGLVNETQKVNALSVLLQDNAISSDQTSVSCVAQAIVNVIEGQNGTHFSPLAANCARVVGHNEVGDGFGILGKGYLSTASAHAALAASQSDTTDTIRLFAKDVERSTDSVKDVITKINNDALRLLADPTTTTQVPEMVLLSGHAYNGFDQNGDGKIEPIIGEAGALTAYTSGQHMAGLILS